MEVGSASHHHLPGESLHPGGESYRVSECAVKKLDPLPTTVFPAKAGIQGAEARSLYSGAAIPDSDPGKRGIVFVGLIVYDSGSSSVLEFLARMSVTGLPLSTYHAPRAKRDPRPAAQTPPTSHLPTSQARPTSRDLLTTRVHLPTPYVPLSTHRFLQTRRATRVPRLPLCPSRPVLGPSARPTHYIGIPLRHAMWTDPDNLLPDEQVIVRIRVNGKIRDRYYQIEGRWYCLDDLECWRMNTSPRWAEDRAWYLKSEKVEAWFDETPPRGTPSRTTRPAVNGGTHPAQ